MGDYEFEIRGRLCTDDEESVNKAMNLVLLTLQDACRCRGVEILAIRRVREE